MSHKTAKKFRQAIRAAYPTAPREAVIREAKRLRKKAIARNRSK